MLTYSGHQAKHEQLTTRSTSTQGLEIELERKIDS
jgi:hypothetical protein